MFKNSKNVFINGSNNTFVENNNCIHCDGSCKRKSWKKIVFKFLSALLTSILVEIIVKILTRLQGLF